MENVQYQQRWLPGLSSRDNLCDCANTANRHLAWILRLMLGSTIFWLVTLCSSGRGWRFGGIQRLHLHGRSVRQTWNQQKQARSWEEPLESLSATGYSFIFLPMLCSFLVSFIFGPWWWRQYAPLKRQAVSEPYGVTTLKKELFRVTGVRT
jgi:hypothetical protein